MKSIKVVAVVIIILLALFFIKVYFLPSNAGQGGPKGPQAFAASAVKVYVSQRAEFSEKLMTTGTAIANEEANLMPEVSGKVVKINFIEGSLIQKGTLLLKVNDTELQAQLTKVSLQIQLAEELEERQQKMLAIEGVSKQDYDVVVNQVNTLKADREYLYAQIRKTEIRAPFTGVIGLRSVSEGAFVSPNTIVASMQQLSPIKIDFSIPEKYVGLLGVGDIVSFSVEGSTLIHQAKVFAIEPKIDLATRTLKVRALSSNKANKVLPGTFVKVEMQVHSSESILIPTESLIPELKGHKVFVYRNGKAVPTKVVASTRTDNKVLIKEGLVNGDTVITSGIMQLKPMSPVNIIEVIQ